MKDATSLGEINKITSPKAIEILAQDGVIVIRPASENTSEFIFDNGADGSRSLFEQ